MLMRIQAEDKSELSFSAEKVFAALADIALYKKWWPKFVKFSAIQKQEEGCGDVFRINPFWGPGFNWVIKEKEVNRKIVLEYFGGIYSGAGVWSIESTPRGVIVKYTIDVRSGSILIRAASKIISVKRLHSYTMRKVFKGLEEYIKRLEKG